MRFFQPENGQGPEIMCVAIHIRYTQRYETIRFYEDQPLLLYRLILLPFKLSNKIHMAVLFCQRHFHHTPSSFKSVLPFYVRPEVFAYRHLKYIQLLDFMCTGY